MALALRLIIAALGVSGVGIPVTILIPGPAQTARICETAFDALTNGKHVITGPWPAVMDSELRFYAPFWGAYGITLLAIARYPARYRRLVIPATATFFIGGIGRAISWAEIGPPHPFFLSLMAIELVLPTVIIGLWMAVRREYGRSAL